MPPLPSVPNVIRVDHLWDDGSDTGAMSRQFFSYSGSPPNSAACVDLAAGIFNHMGTCAECWDENTALIGVKVTDLSSPSGGVGEHAQTQNGIRAGTPLSASSAVLVNYLIGRRYRGGKPRNYLPWGQSGDLNNKTQWAGAFLTLVNSDLSGYFSGVIGTTSGGTTISQHVNVSYYDGFTVITNPVTGRARNVAKLRSSPLVDVILSYAASPRVASQRRRNGR